MKPTQMTRKGLLPQSLKALLAVSFLGVAVSTWATPIPGTVCLTDVGGTITATYSSISNVAIDAPTLTATPGSGFADLQFDVAQGVYFLSPFTGYVIVTALGSPDFVLKYNITTLTGKDSINIDMADTTSSQFASLLSLATTAGASQVPLVPGENLSNYLLPSGDESKQALNICVQCTAPPVPDTTPTWPLLGLAMIGMASMYRFMPRFAKGAR